MVADSAKKGAKAVKRRAARAAYPPAVSNASAVALGGSATTAQPRRLSFAGILSGQLLRNLLNLH
jgi:hypothetical protein